MALDFMNTLDYDALKKLAYTMRVGGPQIPRLRKRWFERLMNRCGWYRQSEWYILRDSQFNQWSFLSARPTIDDRTV